LSLKRFGHFPWIIFDAKGDDLLREIGSIPTVKHISMKDTPDKSGLHYLRATPPAFKSMDFDAFLWRIHRRGRVGLFVDEGYIIERDNDAFNTILTQGRSLQIPVIVLSQRPSWLSRFVFSEADFFQIFALNDARDRKTCEQFVPSDLDIRLQDFHSLYYDVAKDKVCVFSPVPSREHILDTFDDTLRPRKRVI
jgi:hypothetical protein